MTFFHYTGLSYFVNVNSFLSSIAFMLYFLLYARYWNPHCGCEGDHGTYPN